MVIVCRTTVMRIARSKSQTFCAAAIATLLLCAPMVFGALQENCNTIEAAFTLADGDKTYFLSGGEYIEYSLKRESEAKVGPITALGLTRRANHPDAAFTLTNDILVILKECKYFKYVITIYIYIYILILILILIL